MPYLVNVILPSQFSIFNTLRAKLDFINAKRNIMPEVFIKNLGEIKAINFDM